MIRRKKVSFWARKPKTVVRRVRFRTRDGRIISFKTKKSVVRKRKVSFYAKKK